MCSTVVVDAGRGPTGIAAEMTAVGIVEVVLSCFPLGALGAGAGADPCGGALEIVMEAGFLGADAAAAT